MGKVVFWPAKNKDDFNQIFWRPEIQPQPFAEIQEC
jgi:hypothetical protein